MNTKKFLYGCMAFSVLVAVASCTQNTADDSVYEQGVDRTQITKPKRHSVDRTQITKPPRQSVDRTQITKPKRSS